MAANGMSAWANIKKAFRDLWVAGTVGAYFAALSRSLPLHLSQMSLSPDWDWDYTSVVVTRYLYLLWFLAYFFLTNAGNQLRDEEVPGKEMAFDVTQSVVSLTAIYFLGFLVPDHSYGQQGYFAANVAVLGICGLSLWLFEEDARTSGYARLNQLRWAGFLVALVAAAAAAIAVDRAWESVIPQLVAVSILLVLLACFTKVYWPRLATDGPTKSEGLV